MKIKLRNYQCPGDIIVMTGAIRDLKKQYPEYEVTMDTTCNDIWLLNPHVSWNNEVDKTFEFNYDDVHNSDKSGRHFSNAFHIQLEELLDIKLRQSEIWPELYLSDDEMASNKLKEDTGYDGKYWILNAGYKNDFSLKHWGISNYQEVVNRLKGKVKFVQVGEDSPGHVHIPIDGAINYIGRTNIREYIRLAYHSQGSIGPVSMHIHVSAAYRKPCVIIGGGREPFRWEVYPNQRYIHTNGLLPCCNLNACWKKWLPFEVTFEMKAQTTFEGEKWEDKVCTNVVGNKSKCMSMITPDMVIREIMGYYEGGIL